MSVGPITQVTLRPGESSTVVIPLVVRRGYHIQSNPASNEFLIPLELRLEQVDGIRYGSPDYPRGRPYRLEGTDERLMTYHGAVSVTVPLQASSNASRGERLVRGQMSYQACDSRRCLFPTSVPFEFRVTVRN